jgi:hypothetical protein
VRKIFGWVKIKEKLTTLRMKKKSCKVPRMLIGKLLTENWCDCGNHQKTAEKSALARRQP